MGAIVRQATGNQRDPIVLVDYGDLGASHPHHIERRRPSDRLRTALLRAERELTRLEIICEHLEVSDAGAERICWALNTIRAYLEMERPVLGLAEVTT